MEEMSPKNTEDASFALSCRCIRIEGSRLPAAELIHRAVVEARQGKQDEAGRVCPLP